MALGDIFDRLLSAGERALEGKLKYEQAKASLKLEDKVADFATQRYTPATMTQPGMVPADPTWYMTQAEPQNVAQRGVPTYVADNSTDTLLLIGAGALLVMLLIK